jgi:hypothetical protein
MGAVKLHPMPMSYYVLVLCCLKFCEILVPFWKRGCTVCWVAIIAVKCTVQWGRIWPVEGG